MAEKPPILFLHGAFAGPEVWTRFVAPWFAARGHKVVAPRLSTLLPGARLRDYVRRALCGEMLGDEPAKRMPDDDRSRLQAIRRRPRPVAGVVLVSSPGPCGLGTSLWQLSSRAPAVLASLLVAQAGGGMLLGNEAIRQALFTEDTPDAWIRDLAIPSGQESPLALLDGLTWDLPAWFLARRHPTLAVLGDRDAFVPITDLWGIALAYGAETQLVRGAAHGLPIDPHWKSLAWRINAWIDERRIGAGAEPLQIG